MWERLLDGFLTGLMVEDRLTVTYPDRTDRHYGPETGDRVHLQIASTATVRALILNPDLGFGEGVMDGTIRPKDCTLDDILAVLIRNRSVGHMPAWLRTANRARFHARRFI